MITEDMIKLLSLEAYLILLNNMGCNLVDDLDHWAEQGITTALELAEYLDTESEANIGEEPIDNYDYDKYY